MYFMEIQEKSGYRVQLKLRLRKKEQRKSRDKQLFESNTVTGRSKNVLLVYLLKRKKIIVKGMAGLQVG